jgi:hypothetical protein
MRAVIVYESMFGNTRAIAEAIRVGLSSSFEVQLVRAADADGAALDGAELLVVGGPTHAWSMSRPRTRKTAPDYARKPGRNLVLEPGADSGQGVREWLESLAPRDLKAATFDTRIKGPAVITGRASRAIHRSLARRRFDLVAPAQSFLVDKRSHLVAGEIERAEAWGARLAQMVAPESSRSGSN